MQATRRTAITASGGAALGLTGCTADGSAGSSPTSTPSPTSATEPAAPDPDRAALDRATELSIDLLALAAAAGATGDPGGRFTALHTAHLAALDLAGGPGATPTPSSGRRARARLRRREAAAQRELAALAQDAQSGALARLLASMSAGIAAHVAALPRRPVR